MESPALIIETAHAASSFFSTPLKIPQGVVTSISTKILYSKYPYQPSVHSLWTIVWTMGCTVRIHESLPFSAKKPSPSSAINFISLSMVIKIHQPIRSFESYVMTNQMVHQKQEFRKRPKRVE